MSDPTTTVTDGPLAQLTESQDESNEQGASRGLLDKSGLSIESLPGPVNDPESELVLQFHAADGRHLVFRDSSCELKAVYEGPHGAENRPANINERAIEELLDNCAEIALKARKQTALTSPVFAGTL
ncbi:hypothetical protein [Halobacterium hubeiense]|uniref:hypothetical protein n=1 Tax=Halobacterium hubeiense TaxID=1407499 RepID=UPI001179E4EE|nr:hypothetical protein [Halobacterium hubeiense]